MRPPEPPATKDLPTPARPVRFRWAWWLLAYASLGTGIVGIFVPGLPTTVFILISAWAASRGSERLHGWLLQHPRFVPVAWVKWFSIGSMTVVAIWLWPRPLPPAD